MGISLLFTLYSPFLYSSVVTKDSTALQDFTVASMHCIIHL